jgi:hypothetical protein
MTQRASSLLSLDDNAYFTREYDPEKTRINIATKNGSGSYLEIPSKQRLQEWIQEHGDLEIVFNEKTSRPTRGGYMRFEVPAFKQAQASQDEAINWFCSQFGAD